MKDPRKADYLDPSCHHLFKQCHYWFSSLSFPIQHSYHSISYFQIQILDVLSTNGYFPDRHTTHAHVGYFQQTCMQHAPINAHTDIWVFTLQHFSWIAILWNTTYLFITCISFFISSFLWLPRYFFMTTAPLFFPTSLKNLFI